MYNTLVKYKGKNGGTINSHLQHVRHQEHLVPNLMMIQLYDAVKVVHMQ